MAKRSAARDIRDQALNAKNPAPERQQPLRSDRSDRKVGTNMAGMKMQPNPSFRRGTGLLLVLMLLTGAILTRLAAQSGGQPSASVGILPFQDVSGNADLGQLASVLPGMLQSVLLDKTQLAPRQLQGLPPGQAVDIASAAALGQQAGADVVAIGTLLSGSVKTSQGSFGGFGFHGIQVGGNRSKISVMVLLQIDLVDVNRGVKIATLRARGKQSKSHFDPNLDSSNYGTINMQSAGFQNSALGEATRKALDRLAQEMARALRNFQPASAAPPPAPVPAGSPAPVNPAAPAPAAGASSPAAQPNLTAVKIDFVPGDKTLFYDDFTDMAPDEPPPHWKARGDAVTLMLGKNLRQLDLMNTQLTSPRLTLPANFTLQTTFKFPVRENMSQADLEFHTADGSTALAAYLTSAPGQKSLEVGVSGPKSDRLSDQTIPNMDFSQPVKLDLWIQNGRLRAYVNGTRITDVNQIQLPAITHLLVEATPGPDKAPIGLRRVRLAASAPDFASAIASGKYVTHGIHFNTDSAILKPSSAPIIRQVADGLIADPALKLEIDGYTDSIGSARHNLRLSQARAQAVESVLVSQFGIDAGRLTAKGFGAADPIGSNDTAAGRADNRRVEFVKQP